MMVRIYGLLCAAAMVGWGNQQVRDVPGQPTAGTAVIAGTVVAGASGSEPARRATVTLNSVEARGRGYTTTTDDSGRFEFRDVPAGRFTVEVIKAGYLRAAYGATRPVRAGTPVSVADGSRITGLTIRVVRGGAVTGTVRDARGVPVPGVQVGLLKYSYRYTGERQLAVQAISSGAMTDDRGVYRVWGLTPGEYVAMVSPALGARGGSPAGTDFRALTTDEVNRALGTMRAGGAGVPGGSSQPLTPSAPAENYAPVFYPSATDVGLATTIPIAAGEERAGVDITIRLVRTARIGGVVKLPDGAVPAGGATVTLSGAGEALNMLAGTQGFQARSARIDASGRFIFPDVAPGTYSVLAKTDVSSPNPTAAPMMWAMREVAVNGDDADLSLEMRPAMRITGRVLFEGKPPPPTELTLLQIRLIPPGSGGDLSATPAGGHVSADGTFTFAGVTPGPYRMVQQFNSTRGFSDSWTLRSALANGRDTYDAPLVVGPDEHINWILTYTDRPTDIAGVLQDAGGRPASEYFIVVFPADRTSWRPGSFRVRSVRPANDGVFSVKGLPPGDYLLAALTDLESDDLHSSSFLDQLAPLAFRIALAEGQVVKQDLKIGR